LGPEDLKQALQALPSSPRNRKVLVGPETWDDAGVYRISPRLALVQTVDFITPVVNDPYDYGRIAAANSLSDVYAMGGLPTAALSIVCFPEGGDLEILRRMLRGGGEALREAGVALLGGHSVRDREIKFGFAVTGEVHPKRVISNAGAKRGDLLLLTKPLGTGILATALKRRLLSDRSLREMTRSMMELNRAAAEAMREERASAATDITGFGLIGHALNIARSSARTLRIWSRSVPLLKGAVEFASQGVVPGGLAANAAYAERETRYDPGVPAPLRSVLVDPQTSGGLLIAIAPSRADALMRRLTRARTRATVIGEVVGRGRPGVEVAA
jgi:selenide, water dikinase